MRPAPARNRARQKITRRESDVNDGREERNGSEGVTERDRETGVPPGSERARAGYGGSLAKERATTGPRSSGPPLVQARRTVRRRRSPSSPPPPSRRINTTGRRRAPTEKRDRPPPPPSSGGRAPTLRTAAVSGTAVAGPKLCGP